jgi:hypothetical protein
MRVQKDMVRTLSGPAKKYKMNLEAILADLGVSKKMPKHKKGTLTAGKIDDMKRESLLRKLRRKHSKQTLAGMSDTALRKEVRKCCLDQRKESRLAGLHVLGTKMYKEDYTKWDGEPYGSKSRPNTSHPLHQYNKAMNKVIRGLLDKQTKHPKPPAGKTAKQHLMDLARK